MTYLAWDTVRARLSNFFCHVHGVEPPKHPSKYQCRDLVRVSSRLAIRHVNSAGGFECKFVALFVLLVDPGGREHWCLNPDNFGSSPMHARRHSTQHVVNAPSVCPAHYAWCPIATTPLGQKLLCSYMWLLSQHEQSVYFFYFFFSNHGRLRTLIVFALLLLVKQVPQGTRKRDSKDSTHLM